MSSYEVLLPVRLRWRTLGNILTGSDPEKEKLEDGVVGVAEGVLVGETRFQNRKETIMSFVNFSKITEY